MWKQLKNMGRRLLNRGKCCQMCKEQTNTVDGRVWSGRDVYHIECWKKKHNVIYDD